MNSKSRSPEKSKPSTSSGHSQSSGGWQNRLENLWLRFDRFGWDIFGVVLLAIGLITLLGLIRFTEGVFITLWVDFLTRWLGFGSYFVVAFIGTLGLLSLRKQQTGLMRIRLDRVLALEGAAFIVIALLSFVEGHSLDRAEKGLDGGLIGWGLADWFDIVFPDPWDVVVLISLLSLSLFYGFGIIAFIARRIDIWAKMANDEPALILDEILPDEDIQEESKGGVGDTIRKEKKKKREVHKIDATAPDQRVVRDEQLPPLVILKRDMVSEYSEENIHQTASLIEKTLAEFGIPARVAGYRVGPTITQFAVEPGYLEKNGPEGEIVHQKVRVSQISTLSQDLALALSAERLRIEAPVPGESFVGIEVPNPKSMVVGLRSILESEEFRKNASPLGLAIGKDVSGLPVVADLSRMPHLLVAGTTGSGKSVCIAALTICLVMNNSPEELKIVMLDPKMVEFVKFNGLKHLLGKVETDPLRIMGVLRWALLEMDRRYRLLESCKVRDLDSYNRQMKRRNQETLPKIVIMIDELADLMLSAPDQTEQSLVRLAQMARATGIHLIIATQRPSTDVVTGLIKANFPARISFSVASSIDSRVILDGTGAETLLGRGDMLFLNPEIGNPIRCQGVIVTDEEIERVIEFWRKALPEEVGETPWEELLLDTEDGPDQLIEDAISIVRKMQRASASLLQRRLRIGYPRAARLIDELEEMEIVGPSLGGGREREVLLPVRDEDPDDDDLSVDEDLD